VSCATAGNCSDEGYAALVIVMQVRKLSEDDGSLDARPP
jgi:hypothetical protein